MRKLGKELVAVTETRRSSSAVRYKLFYYRLLYAAVLIVFWLLRSGSYTSPLTHSRCSSTASFRATATTARFLAFFPPRALARVPPPRLQPDETSRVATLPEAMRVLDGQHVGRGDQVSYTLHLFEQLRFRISLFGHFFNPPIVFLDAFVQRFHLLHQRLQGFAQSRA